MISLIYAYIVKVNYNANVQLVALIVYRRNTMSDMALDLPATGEKTVDQHIQANWDVLKDAAKKFQTATLIQSSLPSNLTSLLQANSNAAVAESGDALSPDSVKALHDSQHEWQKQTALNTAAQQEPMTLQGQLYQKGNLAEANEGWDKILKDLNEKTMATNLKLVQSMQKASEKLSHKQQEFFLKAASVTINAVAKAYETITGLLSKAWDKIVNFVSHIVNVVVNAVNQAVSWVKSLF
ncbi:TPA: hypothetical protein ACP5VK_004387 [Vibrio parahaemolyticus]